RSADVNLQVESLLQNEKMTPLERVESLVDSYIDKVMEKQQFFKIMICEQVINKNPVIINLIYDLKKKNSEAVSKLIKDGQQKQAFKNNVDVLLLINTLIGSITQMMLTSDYYKEYNNLQSIPDDQFFEQVKEKMSNHIKFLLKALLSYEA
ncbi:MAG: hypothetical protein M3040_07135, partial [Bacteroidota bacterium]|nr:hypothetical protein [Bacteroidota bacterium]